VDTTNIIITFGTIVTLVGRSLFSAVIQGIFAASLQRGCYDGAKKFGLHEMVMVGSSPSSKVHQRTCRNGY
jgi:hypothetical protein